MEESPPLLTAPPPLRKVASRSSSPERVEKSRSASPATQRAISNLELLRATRSGISSFEATDLNGDGLIDQAEWMAFQSRLPQSLREELQKEGGAMMDRWDTNRDGVLDSGEWQAFEASLPEIVIPATNEEIEMDVKSSLIVEVAEKAWNRLDIHGRNYLTGADIFSLAEWVWCSFRPGYSITAEVREREHRRLLRTCDLRGNGHVERSAFIHYYEKLSLAMTNATHLDETIARAPSPEPVIVETFEEVSAVAHSPQGLNNDDRIERDVEMAIARDLADREWSRLDVDDRNRLQGDDITALAEWVWCSFRPRHSITAEAREQERARILRRCDVHGNGSIDRQSFRDYYQKTSLAMMKFQSEADEKIKAMASMSPHTISTLGEIQMFDDAPACAKASPLRERLGGSG